MEELLICFPSDMKKQEFSQVHGGLIVSWVVEWDSAYIGSIFGCTTRPLGNFGSSLNLSFPHLLKWYDTISALL